MNMAELFDVQVSIFTSVFMKYGHNSVITKETTN